MFHRQAYYKKVFVNLWKLHVELNIDNMNEKKSTSTDLLYDGFNILQINIWNQFFRSKTTAWFLY